MSETHGDTERSPLYLVLLLKLLLRLAPWNNVGLPGGCSSDNLAGYVSLLQCHELLCDTALEHFVLSMRQSESGVSLASTWNKILAFMFLLTPWTV
jgi:hypothetical protein